MYAPILNAKVRKDECNRVAKGEWKVPGGHECGSYSCISTSCQHPSCISIILVNPA